MAPSATTDSASTEGYKPKHIEDRLFINGEFVPSVSGKKFDLINPNTEKLSASVYEAGAEDVDLAVKAAQDAFPAWSALSAAERGGWLNKLADAIEKNIEEIGYLEAITMGKPYVGDRMAVIGVQILKYFASKAVDVSGDSSLNSPNMVNITFRQPFGVCGAIIPWNVPLLMFINKVGPALATGNTLVLKSSEKSPLSCLAVARLAQEIGLPKGVLNVLSGFGRPCGEAIAKHMDIRKISFTGSVIAGRAIKKAAAESNLKNVTLELGGKSPLVIFEDADLARAVPAAAFSILANSGQACIASSRVYVHEAIADKFMESMKAAMVQMGQSGDPTVAGTQRGPQADKIQFDRVMSYLTYAKEQGLDMPIGGNRERSQGYFVEPTIIANPPEDSKVMKEEIFGPVVCVNTFTDETEVLKRANDTEYGLYASVFTKDISRAMRVAKAMEAGSVGVNCTSPTMAIDLPFGGWKQSGDGRELSKYSTDYWTELKSVFISL
jgi:aldehyde dehydrogenase (NAD+)